MTHLGAYVVFWILAGMSAGSMVADTRGEGPVFTSAKWGVVGGFAWLAYSVWSLLP